MLITNSYLCQQPLDLCCNDTRKIAAWLANLVPPKFGKKLEMICLHQKTAVGNNTQTKNIIS